MHMADALVSPAVGGAMWAAAAALTAGSARKVQKTGDERKVPLMGVLGAFIFAAQMVNFTIPGTGSSGHLAGGLILAILLGPAAGFMTMASILTVQALFFADGGLLALGCNIFNMGFFACFIAYPLIYKPIAGKTATPARIFVGAMLAAVVSLQLGSLSVVLETYLSDISALPVGTFLLLMQPIHLAIGVVEGLITTAVIGFVGQARPELLTNGGGRLAGNITLKPLLIGFAVAALLTGGVISWFASQNPDGLEWSLFHAAGQKEIAATDRIHRSLAQLQEKVALFPGYAFKKTGSSASRDAANPTPRRETTLSGMVGGGLILLLAILAGLGFRLLKKRQRDSGGPHG